MYQGIWLLYHQRYKLMTVNCLFQWLITAFEKRNCFQWKHWKISFDAYSRLYKGINDVWVWVSGEGKLNEVKIEQFPKCTNKTIRKAQIVLVWLDWYARLVTNYWFQLILQFAINDWYTLTFQMGKSEIKLLQLNLELISTVWKMQVNKKTSTPSDPKGTTLYFFTKSPLA